MSLIFCHQIEDQINSPRKIDRDKIIQPMQKEKGDSNA